MATTKSITLTPINGEPRIHDLLLAERLGFDRPADIRKLIKRHEEKLNKFNHIAMVARTVELGNGAKREIQEYYLNQPQSVFICMKAETVNAFDVQVEIVKVFDAYLNGELKPSLPNFDDPIVAAEAWIAERKLKLLAEQEREEARRELEASRPKIAFHDQVISSETLLDFPQAFSLLQRRTGQDFTRRTFLEFCRRHGIACQPNLGIAPNRFIPRKDYVGTWFVSELHPNGITEWMLRPMAIAGIVQLIELDRQSGLMPT